MHTFLRAFAFTILFLAGGSDEAEASGACVEGDTSEG